MAKKQEKEIEKWVTVNGARVPIFKDGSIGGPKALRDKVKAVVKEKSSDGKSLKDMSATDIGKEYLTATSERKKALLKELHNRGYRRNKDGSWGKQKVGEDKKDSGSKERLSVYERQLAEVNDELANAPKSKALRNEEGIRELEKKKAQLEGYIAKEKGTTAKRVPEHITGAKNVNELHDKLKSQGLSMESADAEDIRRDYRSMNGEKVSLYDKDGNEYRGTFNRYSDGGTEIVDIKKERYNTKDDDTKEKQIARNKAEADDRNNQVSDRVKAYQDKFLKKRSVEEIKEIQSNIEKGSKGVPMSIYDMVAMRAIENELKERNGNTEKAKVKNFESMNSIELSSIDLKKLSADEFSELHKIVKKKYPDKLGLRSRIIEESNRRFFEQSKVKSGTKKSGDIQKRTQERNKILGNFAGRRVTMIPDEDLSTIIRRLKNAGMDASSYEKELARRKK